MGNKEEQNSSLHHKATKEVAGQPATASLEAYISQLQKELTELRKAYARLEYERNISKKALLIYQGRATMEKETLQSLAH